MFTELTAWSVFAKLSLHSAAGSYQYLTDTDKTKADCMKQELLLWVHKPLPTVSFILITDFQYAITKSLGLINKLGHNYQIFFERITSLADNIETVVMIMHCFKKALVVSKVTFLKSK